MRKDEVGEVAGVELTDLQSDFTTDVLTTTNHFLIHTANMY